MPLAETRRTIRTEVSLKQVTALVVIAKASEHTHNSPFVTCAINRWSHVRTILQTIGHIKLRFAVINHAITRSIEVGLLVILNLHTSHHMEMMIFRQFEVIFRTDTEVVIIVLLIFLIYLRIGFIVIHGSILVVLHQRQSPTMIVIILDAIIEINSGLPILDWLNNKPQLMIDIISLSLVLATISP
ncbi:unknown [Prevotella sp. CAG:732]|nr:unknown [Prevotella sp. CAG:732]